MKLSLDNNQTGWHIALSWQITPPCSNWTGEAGEFYQHGYSTFRSPHNTAWHSTNCPLSFSLTVMITKLSPPNWNHIVLTVALLTCFTLELLGVKHGLRTTPVTGKPRMRNIYNQMQGLTGRKNCNKKQKANPQPCPSATSAAACKSLFSFSSTNPEHSL